MAASATRAVAGLGAKAKAVGASMQGGEARPTQRVLVAEDAETSRALTCLLLQAGGYDTDFVGTGADAVEAVRHRRYDLVLMDLDMPVMDGLAASCAIRALPAGRGQIPLLALTASHSRADRLRCREAGMDGHIGKPFSPDELLLLVRRWMERAAPLVHHASLPVWSPCAFDELADRLGSLRMQEALSILEARLVDTLQALRRPLLNRADIEREAHGLVSVAGMLGFAELCDASRAAVMASPQDAEPIQRLGPVIQRALDWLQSSMGAPAGIAGTPTPRASQ